MTVQKILFNPKIAASILAAIMRYMTMVDKSSVNFEVTDTDFNRDLIDLWEETKKEVYQKAGDNSSYTVPRFYNRDEVPVWIWLADSKRGYRPEQSKNFNACLVLNFKNIGEKDVRDQLIRNLEMIKSQTGEWINKLIKDGAIVRDVLSKLEPVAEVPGNIKELQEELDELDEKYKSSVKATEKAIADLVEKDGEIQNKMKLIEGLEEKLLEAQNEVKGLLLKLNTVPETAKYKNPEKADDESEKKKDEVPTERKIAKGSGATEYDDDETGIKSDHQPVKSATDGLPEVPVADKAGKKKTVKKPATKKTAKK